MSIVLGLDIGTSGAKAVAVAHTGEVIASRHVEYELLSPRPNWAEQRPVDWQRAALDVLSGLAQAPGVKTGDIKGLGLTGQMHGSVFLDAKGEVLRNAILWCDQRTAPQCREIEERVGPERLIEMVCNPALTGFTAPKILWVREHEPEVYGRIERVLLPKDYVRYVLTGEFATDVADASGTLLFDVRRRAWHHELMDLLEVPRGWMPPAFEGPEITGKLSAEAGNITGLPEGLPVVAGGGDQAAGAVGCGVVRPGVISASLGTSGVVFAHSEDPRLDPDGRVHTFCHAVPGAWHVMGVVLSAGGSLRWYRDVLCNPERAVAAETRKDPYDYICQAADTAPPGAEGLIFLPYLTGERTPHKDPHAKGAFIGLSLRHRRAHLARAVIEGVSYAMRDNLELVRKLGLPITQIRASGGGARSSVWRQILADIIHSPLVTINVDQGPAYGAALLAAVGTGIFSSVPEACDSTIRVVEACSPNPNRSVVYDHWFGLYQNAYKVLAPEFERASHLL